MYLSLSAGHKRRIKTDEKVKVVPAALGYEIASIHCHTIAIFYQDDLKKRMNRIKAT